MLPDLDKFPPLLRLRYYNAIVDASADLGKPEQIRALFGEFQKYPYEQLVSRRLLGPGGHENRVIPISLAKAPKICCRP